MKYAKEILEPIVKSSTSVAGVMKKLGLPATGGYAHKRMSRAIDEFGIDRSHFVHPVGRPTAKKHWSERLVAGKRCQSNILRRALIESGRPYCCEKCSRGPIWLGEELTLQVDHKNGDDTDNRPDNVRFLCPNCHSQTPNHSKVKCSTARRCACGTKSKVGKCLRCSKLEKSSGIPDKALLRELIWQHPATIIAKKFNVSDKSVSKWCAKYGLAKPGPGYWKKIAR